jgi:hypothetical protein
MFFAKPLPRKIFHPVPIALGEIRKLCQIDGSARPGDFELIGETCRIPRFPRAATDTQALPADGMTPALTLGHHAKRIPALRELRLRPPNFELLRPSVVIRRRPQR